MIITLKACAVTSWCCKKGAGLCEPAPFPYPPISGGRGGARGLKCATFSPRCFTSSSEPATPVRHGETSDRPGEAQADQHQGHRGGGERGGAEEGLQPSPALHPGQGQEHRHAQGLLLRPGSHREGPPGGQVDPNPAVLLWNRPEGKKNKTKTTTQVNHKAALRLRQPTSWGVIHAQQVGK